MDSYVEIENTVSQVKDLHWWQIIISDFTDQIYIKKKWSLWFAVATGNTTSKSLKTGSSFSLKLVVNKFVYKVYSDKICMECK